MTLCSDSTCKCQSREVEVFLFFFVPGKLSAFNYICSYQSVDTTIGACNPLCAESINLGHFFSLFLTSLGFIVSVRHSSLSAEAWKRSRLIDTSLETVFVFKRCCFLVLLCIWAKDILIDFAERPCKTVSKIEWLCSQAVPTVILGSA